MRTVKPIHLSMLTHPYRWQRRDHLGVAVMAMSTLGDNPHLVLEQELWKLTAEEIGPGAVLDLGVPKLVPEVLVSGYAYTRHQQDKTSCAVKLQIAGLQKTLTVHGDRYWLDRRATPPQPFEKIRLDWQHAYGGPGVPENTLGMGTVEELINGVRTTRLAHIETPGRQPTSPRQAVPPAGFGAIPPDWPQRASLMGTQYGQSWLENDYPGLAKDADWRHFNAAPADQRWEGLQEVPTGAAYELWNMHPDIPILRGHLPRWQARCFVQHTPSGPELREVPLRLSTVWFFPHLERMVLIWHGVFPVTQDDAADVPLAMSALERMDDVPRTMAHYESVLKLRSEPERGGLHAMRDKDLAPKEVLSDWADTLPTSVNEPLVRNLRAGQLRDHERRREELRARGLDPDVHLPALAAPEAVPHLDDLVEHLDRMEAQGGDAKARMEEFAKQAASGVLALDAQGDKPLRAEEGQGEGTEDEPMLPVPPAADTASALRQRANLHAAHLSGAEPPAPSFRSAKWRRRLAASDPAQRDFSRLNLTGVDLSGMDLRGARFVQAVLQDTNLRGAQLDDCDFSQAVLVRADLSQASMARAKLFKTNLGGARCDQTVFDDADLREASCTGTRFEGCRMAGARFELTQLEEATLQRCDLSRSRWQQMLLLRLKLEDLHFDGATFDQVTWVECHLRNVSFVGARLERCGFVTADCAGGVDFSNAHLEGSGFAHGCTLVQAKFKSASLKECGLRTTPMMQADLSDARIENSDLSECDLSHARLDRIVGGDSLFIRTVLAGASLREANLIDANLSKADLRGADLTRANLFRADVSQVLFDPATRMDSTYTKHAKVWPARRPEAPTA